MGGFKGFRGTPWTPQEDEILRSSLLRGLTYAEMSNLLPGRSAEGARGRNITKRIQVRTRVNRPELIGAEVGGFSVLRFDTERNNLEKNKRQCSYYICKCKLCGTEKSIISDRIIKNTSMISCGCTLSAQRRQIAIDRGWYTHGLSNSPQQSMIEGAKRHARILGVKFDLKVTDLVIPELCPVFGIKLACTAGKNGPYSPSLDRLITIDDYILENVEIICWRANKIKGTGTLAEFEALLDWMERGSIGLTRSHKEPFRNICRTKEYKIWNSAKQRARRDGVPFDLEVMDVRIPDICPVLGIPIDKNLNKRGPNSPSLDQFIPGFGYDYRNANVISWRANQIKLDATLTEIRLLVDWMTCRYIDRGLKISDWPLRGTYSRSVV